MTSPAAQVEHTFWPGPETAPGAQAWHWLAPDVAANIPAGQAAHAVAPELAENVPGAQVKHPSCPSAEDVPAAQAWHWIAPATAANVPAGQATQALAPASAANVPGAQGVQAPPPPENVPAAHGPAQPGVPQPSAHRQLPSSWATPWPLQVAVSEYWQAGPAYPAAQAPQELPVKLGLQMAVLRRVVAAASQRSAPCPRVIGERAGGRAELVARHVHDEAHPLAQRPGRHVPSPRPRDALVIRGVQPPRPERGTGRCPLSSMRR